MIILRLAVITWTKKPWYNISISLLLTFDISIYENLILAMNVYNC